MKRLTGLDGRGLAHHPRPSHFLRLADSIRNHPVAVKQLDGQFAVIFNLNRIGPDVMFFTRVGMFPKEGRDGRNRDMVCGFGKHGYVIERRMAAGKQRVMMRESPHQHFAFADMIGGADNAFLFHLVNQPCGAVIAQLEPALDIAG